VDEELGDARRPGAAGTVKRDDRVATDPRPAENHALETVVYRELVRRTVAGLDSRSYSNKSTDAFAPVHCAAEIRRRRQGRPCES
jgi:hypothetical protein